MPIKKALAIVAGALTALAIVLTLTADKTAEAASPLSAPGSRAVRTLPSARVFAEQAVFMVLPYTLDHARTGGTGFLIDTPDYGKVVVTNRHVCEAGGADGNLFYLQQGNKEWVARLIAKSQVNDLCIIKAPREVLDHAQGYKLAEGDPIPGQRIYVYGHPLLRPLTFVAGHYVSTMREPINIVKGYAFDPGFVMVIGRVDFTIQPGNSGSPVLNLRNQVVGVLFATEGEQQNGLLVPVSELHRFLQTQD